MGGGPDGRFDFTSTHYNIGETYEIKVEVEITEDTVFDTLVKIFDKTFVYYGYDMTIREFKDTTTDARTNKIYALIDGELELVWERSEDDD